ncbi:MAG: arginase family protein [Bacteroidaceae bacterium]|nr:arginase family protein [Bacteroidaceae bacterium]
MRYPIIIMDFSGVYKYASFYKHQYFYWVDCTDLHGVRYFCDNSSQRIIRQRISSFSPEGIHFIDSGNYHYVSLLWTDKIREPFALIVFDHHPDMKPSVFGNLMSCGSWVKDVIDTNCFIKETLIIGTADNLAAQVLPKYKNKVTFFNESTTVYSQLLHDFSTYHIPYPVYISIDKDVLKPEDAVTDWDNGSLSLEELDRLLEAIIKKNKIIGIDVCGSCSDTLGIITNKRILNINDKCDGVILSELFRALGSS